MTRFFENEQNPAILKACLYLFMLPWQRQICQLNYQKTEVCIVNWLAAIFGDQRIKGFKEKDEWNTGIKSCVQATSLII